MDIISFRVTRVKVVGRKIVGLLFVSSFFRSICTLMAIFRKLTEKAAAIDVFPKVEDDNQNRSERGGLLTLIVTFCLILLTLNELSE